MRPSVGPRDEHVLAAAWATAYLRTQGAEVATVRVNGALIPHPESAAESIRAAYRAEPPGSTSIDRVVDHGRAMAGWMRARLEPWLPSRVTSSELSTPRPRLLENVCETVTLEVCLVNGAAASVPVTVTYRNETIALLGISMSANAGALVCVVPTLGAVPALAGAAVACYSASRAYLSGDLRGGHAAMRTTAKLVGLGLVDLVPVLASVVLSTTLYGASVALEHYKAGDGLVDGTAARAGLNALANTP